MVLELFQKLHPLIYASQFIHDIIESEKCEKKKKKLQQFEYLRKKSFMDETKSFS